MTGNVFDSAGGEPQFVYCKQSSRVNNDLSLACYAAERCQTSICPGDLWKVVGTVVLPISFFKPPGAAASAAAVLDDPLASDAPAAPPSGVQITPDMNHVLVSKDVGAERWAITRNADDHTVTGNVFAGADSVPKFVWCDQTGEGGGNVDLRCYGANQCNHAPCTSDQWSPIGAVSLPLTFFEPPLTRAS